MFENRLPFLSQKMGRKLAESWGESLIFFWKKVGA